MRTTSLLRVLLGIQHAVVEDFDIDMGELMVFVKPSWRRPRCSGCGRMSPGYDRSQRARSWRHLHFGGVSVLLRYRLRRVSCKRCGVVAERVPWASSARSRFTVDFEDQVAYLAQRTDKTTVVALMRVTWRTVGKLIERAVARRRPKDPLADLSWIGVDELSYRKGHRYLTLVSNHRTGRIVWAHEGKTAETLKKFFEELGEERCQKIEVVSMDMSNAYRRAVKEMLPNAQVVYDRFHVQALVNKAMDETRREEWRSAREAFGLRSDEAKAVKGLRWTLLKNPWNLTGLQRRRLATLQVDNNRLYRAYLLKESFAAILDRRQPNVAKRCLEDWVDWASRSRLPAFVKVSRTIRKHIDDIIAYIGCRRVSNGLAEGLNNKARLLTRRAYGFHSPGAAIAMIMLCCTGLHLKPVTKSPWF